jgi:hypothetical protein
MSLLGLGHLGEVKDFLPFASLVVNNSAADVSTNPDTISLRADPGTA